MNFCPNCGQELEEGATVCSNCGEGVGAAVTTILVKPYDHTDEFDEEDIQNNKIYALICYLLGIPGLIITYLAAKESPYAMFHAKQGLKIEVAVVLASFVVALTFWTCLTLIAYCIFVVIVLVLLIIAMIQVMLGLAKEPWLIRSLKFLGK